MTRLATPVEERLGDKFTIGPGCWIWHAAIDDNGYGRVHNPGGSCLAHVVLYEFVVGPVPDGLELDHTCRTPSCVRPSHMEPVTHAENMARVPRELFDSHSHITRCPRDHAYTPANTYRRNGSRHCKACKLESQRRHRALKREGT